MRDETTQETRSSTRQSGFIRDTSKLVILGFMGLCAICIVCGFGTVSIDNVLKATNPDYATSVAQASATKIVPPTPTPTPTQIPKPQINIFLLGCKTSNDVVRGIGELTNAFVVVQNVGKVDISNVVVTLNVNDKGSQRHPDQMKSVQYMPAGYEVTLKLSADTELGEETSVEVVVTAKEGVKETTSRSDCREIDEDLLNRLSTTIEIVKPF